MFGHPYLGLFLYQSQKCRTSVPPHRDKLFLEQKTVWWDKNYRQGTPGFFGRGELINNIPHVLFPRPIWISARQVRYPTISPMICISNMHTYVFTTSLANLKMTMKNLLVRQLGTGVEGARYLCFLNLLIDVKIMKGQICLGRIYFFFLCEVHYIFANKLF